LNGHILTGIVVVIYAEAAVFERRLSANTSNIVKTFDTRPSAIRVTNIHSVPKINVKLRSNKHHGNYTRVNLLNRLYNVTNTKRYHSNYLTKCFSIYESDMTDGYNASLVYFETHITVCCVIIIINIETVFVQQFDRSCL